MTDNEVISILKGKSALFFGDSLCAATVYDKDHLNWGWAGRINRDYGLSEYKNFGIDGASVSDIRGVNTVINQIEKAKTLKADFVVLEGSTNDGWDSAPVGNVSEEPYDVTKFAGGLEDLFYKTKKYFPDASIVYIFNYRLDVSEGTMKDMTAYEEQALLVCKKWGIPCLDLYADANFALDRFCADRQLAADGIHPYSAGYDLLYPVIAQFMAANYEK